MASSPISLEGKLYIMSLVQTQQGNYYHYRPAIHNFSAAEKVLPFVFSILKPKSILDVGCGTGTWLYVAKQLGVSQLLGLDSLMVDPSKLHIGQREFMAVDLRFQFDVNRRFDLVISLEVAEHLPESSADDFIASIVRHGDVILFSAAIPYQGGQNHLNEQWPSYWHEKFKNHGFCAFDFLRLRYWDDTSIEPWYRQNMLLYVKTGIELPGYEPVDHVLPLLHPDCFIPVLEIGEYSNHFRQKMLFEPNIGAAFKTLLKAIALKFGVKLGATNNG